MADNSLDTVLEDESPSIQLKLTPTQKRQPTPSQSPKEEKQEESPSRKSATKEDSENGTEKEGSDDPDDPFGIARDLRLKDLKDDSEDEDDISEGMSEEDIFMSTLNMIKEMEGLKEEEEKLKEEVKKLDEETMEAKGDFNLKRLRIGELQRKVEDQETMIKKREKELNTKLSSLKKLDTGKRVDMGKQMDDALKLLEELKYNTLRLSRGNGVFPKGALRILAKETQEFVIFIPGLKEALQGKFLEEISKAGNVSVEGYGSKSGSGLIDKVASHKLDGERDATGVVFLKWDEETEPVNKKILDAKIMNFVNLLELLGKKETTEFTKIILVIPPADKTDREVLRLLSEKMKGREGVIDLMRKQRERGEKEKDGDDVWKKDGDVFSTIFRPKEKEIEPPFYINSFSFNWALSEIAILYEDVGGEKAICTSCGNEHQRLTELN